MKLRYVSMSVIVLPTICSNPELPIMPPPPEPVNIHIEEDLSTIPATRVFEFIEPLIRSRSVDGLIHVLQSLSLERVREVVTRLLEYNYAGLTSHDRVQLVMGIADVYPNNVAVQQALFALIPASYDVNAVTSPLLIALRHGYRHALEPYRQWRINSCKGSKAPACQSDPLVAALYGGVRISDAGALKNLCTLYPAAMKEYAGNLVLYAVEHEANPNIIAQLHQCGANMNYSDKSGMTPLVKAIILKNMELVQALVESGADVNYFADPAVGTPLQKTIINGSLDIEKYLRAHGARE